MPSKPIEWFQFLIQSGCNDRLPRAFGAIAPLEAEYYTTWQHASACDGTMQIVAHFFGGNAAHTATTAFMGGSNDVRRFPPKQGNALKTAMEEALFKWFHKNVLLFCHLIGGHYFTIVRDGDEYALLQGWEGQYSVYCHALGHLDGKPYSAVMNPAMMRQLIAELVRFSEATNGTPAQAAYMRRIFGHAPRNPMQIGNLSDRNNYNPQLVQLSAIDYDRARCLQGVEPAKLRLAVAGIRGAIFHGTRTPAGRYMGCEKGCKAKITAGGFALPAAAAAR